MFYPGNNNNQLNRWETRAEQMYRRLSWSFSLLCCMFWGLAAFSSTAIAQSQDEASEFKTEDIEFFEREVRPLLVEHCYECHSGAAKKLQAGLRLDSRHGVLTGGDSGPAIDLDDLMAGLLLESVRYEGYEMPPTGKLDDASIAVFEKWVRLGAPWPPGDTTADTSAAAELFDLEARRVSHWAWQPIQDPSPPEVHNKKWPKDDIDRFILHRLEQAGGSPTGDASRNQLVRRLYMDLTGLPPTPEELASFLVNDAPDATERLVDQLLDSPRFGERWGRHWLDLVRYAESRGHEFDEDARNAFQYRDYIIRALNANVPYDQLVREHIAGDLLESPRLAPDSGANESVLGTGFWFLGEWVHSPVDIRKDESDRFDNMIDVMSKTFLGVTVSCARCHDHKFDAISTEDYYALSGFLQSSQYRQVRFESMEHNRRIAQMLDDVDTRYRKQIDAYLNVGLIPDTKLPPDLQELVVLDYACVAPSDYLPDGYTYGQRPIRAGQWVLADEQDDSVLPAGLGLAARTAASNDAFWQDLQLIDEPGINRRDRLQTLPRPGRTLRTPTFTVESGQVACLVRGKGHVFACVDSHRLVAGPLHGETIVPIAPDQQWVKIHLSRYIGHRIHLEFTPETDSNLSVELITQGATTAQLDAIAASRDMSANQVAAAEEQVAERLRAEPEVMEAIVRIARRWREERTSLASQVKSESQLAMAMFDGTPEDDFLLIRGSSANPGKQVPRRFLTALEQGDRPNYRGSGRLQLAEQINAPDNPLTHRVLVNRIWHHLIGRGIVATTDDFGVLGQRPTHPELLDHLVIRFRHGGQSIKSLIRAVVLSRTYQLSDVADDSFLQTDPTNLLWQYRPPRRLQGEAIRDTLLALSGKLDETRYGPPIPIHLTDFMTGRGRPDKNGPPMGDYRRSIYIAVRRNFLSPFMLAFDTPVPFSTMGRRTDSNVPAQALILMNDPVVMELAAHWAKRSKTEIARSIHVDDATNEVVDVARLEWLYQSAFCRTPNAAELHAALAFLAQKIDDAKARGTERMDSQEVYESAWSELAHALVNTKEFIFVR